MVNQTEEIEGGVKRKIDSLLRVNGHKLRPITDIDAGWVRCTECARIAGGMSDIYWSSNSCNRNQCISSECWSRKGCINLSKRKEERKWQLRNMAIKEKESGQERELTRFEKEGMIKNREEAMRRRVTKLHIN